MPAQDESTMVFGELLVNRVAHLWTGEEKYQELVGEQLVEHCTSLIDPNQVKAYANKLWSDIIARRAKAITPEIVLASLSDSGFSLDVQRELFSLMESNRVLRDMVVDSLNSLKLKKSVRKFKGIELSFSAAATAARVRKKIQTGLETLKQKLLTKPQVALNFLYSCPNATFELPDDVLKKMVLLNYQVADVVFSDRILGLSDRVACRVIRAFNAQDLITLIANIPAGQINAFQNLFRFVFTDERCLGLLSNSNLLSDAAGEAAVGDDVRGKAIARVRECFYGQSKPDAYLAGFLQNEKNIACTAQLVGDNVKRLSQLLKLTREPVEFVKFLAKQKDTAKFIADNINAIVLGLEKNGATKLNSLLQTKANVKTGEPPRRETLLTHLRRGFGSAYNEADLDNGQQRNADLGSNDDLSKVLLPQLRSDYLRGKLNLGFTRIAGLAVTNDPAISSLMVLDDNCWGKIRGVAKLKSDLARTPVSKTAPETRQLVGPMSGLERSNDYVRSRLRLEKKEIPISRGETNFDFATSIIIACKKEYWEQVVPKKHWRESKADFVARFNQFAADNLVFRVKLILEAQGKNRVTIADMVNVLKDWHQQQVDGRSLLAQNCLAHGEDGSQLKTDAEHLLLSFYPELKPVEPVAPLPLNVAAANAVADLSSGIVPAAVPDGLPLVVPPSSAAEVKHDEVAAAPVIVARTDAAAAGPSNAGRVEGVVERADHPASNAAASVAKEYVADRVKDLFAEAKELAVQKEKALSVVATELVDKTIQEVVDLAVHNEASVAAGFSLREISTVPNTRAEARGYGDNIAPKSTSEEHIGGKEKARVVDVLFVEEIVNDLAKKAADLSIAANLLRETETVKTVIDGLLDRVERESRAVVADHSEPQLAVPVVATVEEAAASTSSSPGSSSPIRSSDLGILRALGVISPQPEAVAVSTNMAESPKPKSSPKTLLDDREAKQALMTRLPSFVESHLSSVSERTMAENMKLWQAVVGDKEVFQSIGASDFVKVVFKLAEKDADFMKAYPKFIASIFKSCDSEVLKDLAKEYFKTVKIGKFVEDVLADQTMERVASVLKVFQNEYYTLKEIVLPEYSDTSKYPETEGHRDFWVHVMENDDELREIIGVGGFCDVIFNDKGSDFLEAVLKACKKTEFQDHIVQSITNQRNVPHGSKMELLQKIVLGGVDDWNGGFMADPNLTWYRPFDDDSCSPSAVPGEVS